MDSKYNYPKREIAQSEALHKTAKIVSGLIPGGSSVYELFTALVQPLHEQRREEWVREVTLRLHKLEQDEKINLEELAQNEEFNTIITNATLKAQQTHQQEKIEALRNVVVNAAEKLPGEIVEFDDLNYFLRIIDEITPLHILLLKTFQNPEKMANEKGVEFGRMLSSSSKHTLFKIHPELKSKEDFIKIYWNELSDYSLVKTNSLSVMVTGEGALNALTSDLGNQFLEMIESDE